MSITADDSIRWKNNDTKNHQIVSTRGTFASPVIGPGKTYTFTFTEAGTYDYRDALYPSRTGTVKVAGLPPAVTFGVSLPQIGYGTAVTLTGQVNNKKAGEQVTIASTPYGQLSPVVLANVVTGADGTFAYTTKPQLLTSYLATWKGVNSLAATVAVAPVITFGRNNGWVSKVYAGRSMVAKTIQVQMVSKFGQWVTIKRVRVGTGNVGPVHASAQQGRPQAADRDVGEPGRRRLPRRVQQRGELADPLAHRRHHCRRESPRLRGLSRQSCLIPYSAA